MFTVRSLLVSWRVIIIIPIWAITVIPTSSTSTHTSQMSEAQLGSFQSIICGWPSVLVAFRHETEKIPHELWSSANSLGSTHVP